MRQRADQLKSVSANAIAIFPMEASLLHGWFDGAGSRIHVAGDPHREVFCLYGVGRFTWTQLVTRRTLREGFQARKEAELPALRGGDPLGQPALFVIDQTQRVRMAYLSSDMADRPVWDEVFAIFGETSGISGVDNNDQRL